MFILVAHHLGGIIGGAATLGAQHIVLDNGDVQRVGCDSLVGGVVELHPDIQRSGRPIQRALGRNVHRGGCRQDLVGLAGPFPSAHRRGRAGEEVPVDGACRIPCQTCLIFQRFTEWGGVSVV